MKLDPHSDPTYNCPQSEDGLHCEHWVAGGKCCTCEEQCPPYAHQAIATQLAEHARKVKRHLVN